MTNPQKDMLIHANPVDAYTAFIVNEHLENTHRMLKQTVVNALCRESGIYKSKYELLASQQALFMMLNLEMI